MPRHKRAELPKPAPVHLLDTNVILRFLIGDDPPKASRRCPSDRDQHTCLRRTVRLEAFQSAVVLPRKTGNPIGLCRSTVNKRIRRIRLGDVFTLRGMKPAIHPPRFRAAG